MRPSFSLLKPVFLVSISIWSLLSRIWWTISVKSRKLSKAFELKINFAFICFLQCFHTYRTHKKMVQEKNQTEKFVECVHLHRNMLWLTEKLKNLYSPIVFFQFFFSCLQICAITLELILVYYFLISYFFPFHSIWCAFSMST